MHSGFVTYRPVHGLSKNALPLRPTFSRSHSSSVNSLVHGLPFKARNDSKGFTNTSRDTALQKKGIVCRAGADPIDRACGSATYLLPLFDGLQYGVYIFTSYPIFTRILGPVFPLYQIFRAIPFSSVIAFFGLYLGVVRNPNVTRFVRFNAMQAVLIDLLLAFPGVIQQLFRISSEVRVPLYNVTWIYVFCCTVIGIASCCAGRSARLPLVAEASDAQCEQMSNVYSSTRPLFADGPQTPVFKELEDYAQRLDVQQLMHEMLTELLIERPEDPIAFMIDWLHCKRGTNLTDDTKSSLQDVTL